jgi:hypothetical protein
MSLPCDALKERPAGRCANRQLARVPAANSSNADDAEFAAFAMVQP